jgi:hypothetical protein
LVGEEWGDWHDALLAVSSPQIIQKRARVP